MSELPPVPPPPPAPMNETRPMLWSVRRELWENRSIVIGPVAVASVVLFGFLVSEVGFPERRRNAMHLAPAAQRAAIEMSYDLVAFMLLLTAFVVGVFYCLDALYGERRDRSILFWKSLPISDRTAVLSKLTIPLGVLPAFIFPIIVVSHIIMLIVNAAVLAANGLNIAIPWMPPFFSMWLALLYCLIAIALWHAPLYAWLLMISGWARRTLVWAVLPPFAVIIFEKIAFGTNHFAAFLGYRIIGWFEVACVPMQHGAVPANPLETLTPIRFLLSPGLWLGLIAAAVFVAAAIRLRRDRDPI